MRPRILREGVECRYVDHEQYFLTMLSFRLLEQYPKLGSPGGTRPLYT